MEKHGDWAQPNDFHLNGLLLKGPSPVSRVLDPRRWAKAEERVAELISQIQPNCTSEKHRNDVASYVRGLITHCVPCQVFAFGSVPLKTYLPDGDIDLTAFSDDHTLKDDLTNSVLDLLRSEEHNEHAEFQVKEVQYIQAEVKIIKCLVDNIVVDISFNQLGGLCTLCFLEEVDFLIGQNHLFKRSIILIKAWCYYESRILGAHHGLISTYALEILVLYIFHVFNNCFAGPLEVLYRFVEFFSIFDWANFCVSLWGPVPICSLPNMAADPPRKDGADLLLDKVFLDACKTVYSVIPEAQDNQEQHFMSKYLNVVDPLRTNNNLGRSVSKGNFYRIRSAFTFGAQKLARILECPEENIVAEVNQFFVNTWDRHGKGCRPDAPLLDSLHLRKANTMHDGNHRKNIVENPADDFVSYHQPDISHCKVDFSMQSAISPVIKPIDTQKDLQSLREKDNVEVLKGNWGRHYIQRRDLSKKEQLEKERICGLNLFPNRGHPRPNFARTSSSPELMGMPSKAGSPHKHNAATEMLKDVPYSRSEYNTKCYEMENHVGNYVNDKLRSKESSSQPSHCTSASSHSFVSKSVSSSSKTAVSNDDKPSLRYEGEDFMNVMSPSGVQNYDGHAQMPINLASHQYFPFITGIRPQIYSGKLPVNLTTLQPDWSDVPKYANGPSGSQEAEWTDSNPDSMREFDDEPGEFATASSRLSPASTSNSFKTKESSEYSRDGKTFKVKNPVRYPSTKHSSSSLNPTEVVNSPWLDDGGHPNHSYDDVNDNSDSASVTSSHTEVHPSLKYEQAPIGYPNSLLPFAPMFVHPGSHQGGSHSHAVPIAIYPAGPMPFVTMVPLYNGNAQRGKATTPASNDDVEVEKPTFAVSQQSSDVSKDLEHFSTSYSNGSLKRTISGEKFDEGGNDIFSSDFRSHWKNLQYGRHCQNSQLQHSFICSPSYFVPPSCSEGNIPFDSPQSPQLDGPDIYTHLLPVAQQPGPTKPAGVSMHYGGEFTKNRNGTGTYFPNPKFLRDYQVSTFEQNQGDSRHDRNDQHWEKEENWKCSPKPRFGGRAQPRYRYDKPNSRMDRPVASGSQSDRHFDTFRKKSHQFNRFPRGTSNSKPIWNVHYDANHPVYQKYPRYYHNEVCHYGDALPPLVMLYPSPQTIAYGAQLEPVQFGSVRPQQYVGLGEVQEVSGYPKRFDYEFQSYHGDTGPPSPDYASPPRFPW